MISNTRGPMVLANPVTEPIEVGFSGAEKLSTLSNKRIGLIDVSKVNAKELLEATNLDNKDYNKYFNLASSYNQLQK